MVKLNSKSHNGRSMVEMLGVLAIVGVLSVGGVYGYGVAMKKHKANEALHKASMLATTVSAYAMSNDGNLPSSITDFANLGYETSLTDDGTQFKLTMKGVGYDVCKQMESSMGGVVRKVTCVEGSDDAVITYYKNLATDPAEGEKSPTGENNENSEQENDPCNHCVPDEENICVNSEGEVCSDCLSGIYSDRLCISKSRCKWIEEDSYCFLEEDATERCIGFVEGDGYVWDGEECVLDCTSCWFDEQEGCRTSGGACPSECILTLSNDCIHEDTCDYKCDGICYDGADDMQEYCDCKFEGSSWNGIECVMEDDEEEEEGNECPVPNEEIIGYGSPSLGKDKKTCCYLGWPFSSYDEEYVPGYNKECGCPAEWDHDREGYKFGTLSTVDNETCCLNGAAWDEDNGEYRLMNVEACGGCPDGGDFIGDTCCLDGRSWDYNNESAFWDYVASTPEICGSCPEDYSIGQRGTVSTKDNTICCLNGKAWGFGGECDWDYPSDGAYCLEHSACL